MGYDMHWMIKPEGEDAALAEAKAVFDAACQVRNALPKEEAGQHTREEIKNGNWDDAPANASEIYKAAQAAVTEANAAIDKAHRSYFRLNIFGMSRYRNAMADLGMVYSNYDEDARPSPPDNVPDEYWNWEYGEDTLVSPDNLALFRKIKKERVAWLEWAPRGIPGIPVHKLCSNDGFIVTPTECYSAVALLRAAEPAEVSRVLSDNNIQDVMYWNDWVAWIDDAQHHGGFEVN